MEYLIKSSAILAIFYFCYNLFLQRDTFFQSNRWFFIAGLITAILIPLVVIPIYITVQPQEFIYTVSNLAYSNENTITPFDWDRVLTTIYFLGVSIFAARLLIQIYSLVSLIIRNKKQRSGKFIFVEVEDNISPFSFFNWIVFNPNQFKQTELEQIITHEKVHANQFHSIDILLIQIASVVFWCNPLIWFYKKELHQNLEFIADNEAQKQASCERSYQHLLLKASMPNYQMALTNNFYNSLIKKRIVMLHKNRSKNRNHWKFILILPILALFIMSFNTKEIIVDTESSKSIINNNEVIANEIIEIIITKDFSETDFKKIKEKFADAGITIKFKSIKRNGNDEIIAIKIVANTKSSNANFNINSDDPIKPIKITIDNETNSISIGNGSDHHFGKGEGYSFISKDGNHKFHTSGKGNNTFFLKSDDDDDDHDNVFIIKKNGKVYEVKRIHKDIKTYKNKNYSVFVISDTIKIKKDNIHFNGNVVIDIDTDHDTEIIIIKDKDGNIVKREIIGRKQKDGKVIVNGDSIIWNHDDENIWTTDKDKNFTIVSLGKGKNKIFISGDSEKQLLLFIDGKEASKKVFLELDPDTIDKVEVLKGEAAIKEYGKKGENGVIIITTKKKE